MRRVDNQSVSVWIANSEPAVLHLSIFDGIVDAPPGGALLTMQSRNTSTGQPTVRVGNGLHIGVVTLGIAANEALLPGFVYSYNIAITDNNGVTVDLNTLGLLAEEPLVVDVGLPPKTRPHVAIGYAANRLPSFVLPPAKLDDLRIYHASCRKPHGQDPDALEFLDFEIQAGMVDPIHRPHQFFLTGDQIYADEVPVALLPHISEIGRTLIGTKELLPVDGDEIEVTESTLPPGFRSWFMREFIGFSSSSANSHVISLGEYCALYLFSLSNVLWPDMDTPSDNDTTIPKSLSDISYEFRVKELHLDPSIRHPIFESDSVASLVPFFNELTPDQRRALESDDYDDGLIGSLIKHADSKTVPEGKYGFLVEKAMELADTDGLTPPGGSREKTIKQFFWFAKLRRSAWAQVRPAKPSQKFLRHTIANQYDALPKVRRALANIATYMIFDDHDVTDDWNISREWQARVNARPLGRAVMRNALVAYGMFQGWGNDPRQFEPGGPNEPLLQHTRNLYPEINGVVQPTPQSPAADQLDLLFGIGNSASLAKWHYQVPNKLARTIVLDTRTQREFLGFTGAPNLISGDSLGQQLPAGPLLADEQILIVVSASPVLDLAVLEEIVKPLMIRYGEAKEAIKAWRDGRKAVLEGDMEFDLESWSANPKGFEALLARLASYQRVVALSGDVHFGASADLSYWRKNFAAPSRIVQFTSSPAKNQIPRANSIFIFTRTSFAQRLMRLDTPLERLGWADDFTDPVTFSTTKPTPPSLRARTNISPVLLPVYNWPAGTVIADAEWSWRLRLLQDKRLDSDRPELVHSSPIELDGEITPSNAFESYRKIARRHADSLDKALFARQMVFATNIGRVSFDSSSGTITARQDLLAVHPSDDLSTPLPYTRYEASLAPTTEQRPQPEIANG